MGEVSWMGVGYPPDPNAAKRSDVKDLLVELGVLGKDGDQVSLQGTPQSLQVLTAGSTAIAKWWSGVAAAGLGGSALVSGLKALNWWPGKDVAGGQQIALTLSGALLAATAAIAIAIIVRGDVMGRATASAAEYAARASITTALVKAFTYAAPAPVTQAAAPQHVVLTKGNEWHRVREFSWESGALVAVVSDTLSIPASDFAWVSPIPDA